MRLAHVNLSVSDLSRSMAFYQDLFGMRLSEYIPGNFAFLTVNNDHHVIALTQGDKQTYPGDLHIAFEIDKEEFTSYQNRLKSKDIPFQKANYGISQAIYFQDPDGYVIELYIDTRKENKVNTWSQYMNRKK